MTYAQILDKRPFNVNDGERYLITTMLANGTTQVFTRSYKKTPLFSEKLCEAKTFKELSTINNSINNFIIPNKLNYTIYQVKDLFEARYFIKYVQNEALQLPYILCYPDWFIKGETNNYTHLTYEAATKALDYHKCDLIEHYYKIIMNNRKIVVPKII